jgi:hypothetical protein
VENFELHRIRVFRKLKRQKRQKAGDASAYRYLPISADL